MVTGSVVGTEDPDAEPLPGAALGSWQSLKATPAWWKAPKCVARDEDGCRKYEGTFAAATSDAKAVEDVRRSLQAGRYAISSDSCPQSGPVDVSCIIEVRRFRTVGSRDGVVLSIHIRRGDANGFEVDITGEPYPA
jgi:hypothetical protein